MSKPRRIVTTEYFYHLYNRFVGGYHLFESKEIVDDFFDIFNRNAGKYGISVYALYCMSNHFHALIKLTEENLSEFIQRYSTQFCRLVNRKLKRKGHVFQTRHKTQIVQTDKYLKTVVKYIFNNARRAGIVNQVEDYHWSNLDEIINTYPNNEKYKELFELLFARTLPIKKIIEWLNSEEKNEDIKAVHNQFLTDENERENILKKIEYTEKNRMTQLLTNEPFYHQSKSLRSDLSFKISEISSDKSQQNINIPSTISHDVYKKIENELKNLNHFTTNELL
ncbi:MAG TPA: transposase, partial [bacterium]|nr:transposase [bacterium]